MKPNSSLALRLELVKKQIEKACHQIGKKPENIQLVAVSKAQPFERIIEAYNLGLRNFGESYAQELNSKISQASRQKLTDICWHFIGAIQSNKINMISQAQFVHSVSSIRHAKLLSNAAQHELSIFLQVKLQDGAFRLGFSPQEVLKAFDECSKLSNLKVIGLMAILPLESVQPNRHWFSLMHDLRAQLGMKKLKLSMGMSNDFLEAIAYGSDVIRLGTSIFGSRNS